MPFSSEDYRYKKTTTQRIKNISFWGKRNKSKMCFVKNTKVYKKQQHHLRWKTSAKKKRLKTSVLLCVFTVL